MLYVNMICVVSEESGRVLKGAETNYFITPKEGVGRSNRLGDANKSRGYSSCRDLFSIHAVVNAVL